METNKPFEYFHNTGPNSLKASDDTSTYSKYLCKSNNVRAKRLASEKVSPHEFQTSPSMKPKTYFGENSDDEKASENFSQVYEDEDYSHKTVPEEPPKKSVYSGLVKSPNLLSEETSKKSFDHSKSKEILTSFNESNSLICKTHSHSTYPLKFKELNLTKQSSKATR